MAKLSYYLDTRTGKKEFPLKIRISQKKENVYINLGIKIATEQWDEESGVVIGHPKAKTYNASIGARMQAADEIVTRLTLSGKVNKYSAAQLRTIIENNGEIIEEEEEKVGFKEFYISCIEKKRKESTASSYRQALTNLERFDEHLDIRSFEDINIKYLESFDRWMDERGITQNSRNVYYRNIRSVFNEALDEELTHNYPFRKFKLKKVVTRKRSLTVEELRMLRDYPCEEWQEKFRDIFMLMFYLCGINAADLYPARKEQVRKGRLEYERAKTYKGYSVKIEPEAQKIIDKYKGDEYLLKFCEGGKDYKYFLQRMSRELKKIGPYTKKGLGGRKIHEPLLPELTQYWCRHTWATIAAELDIPKETIAAALGHDMGNSTTAIYINFNQKKVDEANRRVIDFLNEK